MKQMEFASLFTRYEWCWEMSKENISNKIFIVAELSANHGHDIQVAKESILAAKEAGADAIKLQTYTADTLTIDCNNEYFTLNSGTIWDGTTLYELYKQASTPWEWHEELFNYAKQIEIKCFSTPFDNSSVDFLERFNPPLYKVASFELLDIPLIKYIASKNRPIIMSTGIAMIDEVDDAISACKEVGNDDITLLKCTSSYPTELSDSNLLDITFLKERYNVNVGLSDHTLGNTAAQVAVGLGARVFEKHFILDKSIGGPDSSFSVDKNELKEYVKAIRDAESALGVIGEDFNNEKKSGRQFARSLFVVEDISKGDVFTSENIRSIRPGNGIPPKFIDKIIGSKTNKDIKRGTPLNWDMISS